MKKIFVTLLLTSLSLNCLAKVSADDVIGFWLTKEKKAVIQVMKIDNKYEGRIVWLEKIHTGEDKNPLDEENPKKELQSRSLLNMKNLWGFEFDGTEWAEGNIYDPKSGKTYSAKIKMKDKNNLDLRGYVGIPLFGKTSSWTREAGRVPAIHLK